MSRGPRHKDERLERVQRNAANGHCASLDDTLWMVQRIHTLQSLVRAADEALLQSSNTLRMTVKLIADCREGLEPHRGGPDVAA